MQLPNQEKIRDRLPTYEESMQDNQEAKNIIISISNQSNIPPSHSLPINESEKNQAKRPVSIFSDFFKNFILGLIAFIPFFYMIFLFTGHILIPSIILTVVCSIFSIFLHFNTFRNFEFYIFVVLSFEYFLIWIIFAVIIFNNNMKKLENDKSVKQIIRTAGEFIRLAYGNVIIKKQATLSSQKPC